MTGFHSLRRLFEKALEQRVFSAACLLIANRESIVFHESWGHTKYQDGQPMRTDIRFDLASLTKPLITTSLCMWAVGCGEFSLDDSLGFFFSSNRLPPEKRKITPRHLLSHCSGLPAYKPFFRELIYLPASERRATLLSQILDIPLLSAPGQGCLYSDLGFMLLGMMLEEKLGGTLDQLALKVLFQPLTLDELSFCSLKVSSDPATPPEESSNYGFSYVATELCPWRKRLLEGEVHDENAYTLGGIAGHAGLFGTAYGVYRLLAFLWDVFRGATHKDPAWSSQVVRTFWTKPLLVSNSTWTLGFDSPSVEHSSAGDYFSPHSVGHLGFTGASLWLDLDQEILVVLLTNRVHPSRENDRIKTFRPLLHNLVMKAYNELSRY